MGLVEWLKVKALSLSPISTKKQNKTKQKPDNLCENTLQKTITHHTNVRNYWWFLMV
jgi:hypothetical protein